MEIIISNLSGNIRRQKFEGRDFLVAPITLLVPGVLNGSRGPLFYPLSEVSKNPDAWDGMPMLLNHPAGISGRTPQVIEATGVGMLFNAKVNGKLVGEGWFDIEKSNRLDSRLISAIENGQKVEVSTGLKISTDDNGGTHNGERFIGTASNFLPDHLAILLDTAGACSVKDGCGINTNEDKLANNTNTKEAPMPLTQERRTEIVNDLVENCGCWKDDDREYLDNIDARALTQFQAVMQKAQGLKTELTENQTKLEKQTKIVEAAQKGISIGDTKFALNAEGKFEEIEAKEKKEVENTTPVEFKMSDLPKEAQAAIAYGNRVQNERKDELIEILTANVMDDEEKEKQKKRLKGKDLEDLEEDAKLQPKKNKETKNTMQSYVGAGAGGSVANKDKKDPVPGLPLPVINWGE